MPQRFYLASQDGAGGIYLCSIDGAGNIRTEDFCPLPGCAWLAADGGKLYAVLREPFQQQSGVVSFDILPDGKLANMSRPQPTHGSIAAFLLADKGQLYCANYLSGSVVLLPDRVAAYSGSGPVSNRQDCSHPHCVARIPGSSLLAVADLGTDRIYVCTEELDTVSTVVMPAGSGPRHIVFSPDGKYAYCSLELTGEAAVLERRGDGLRYLSRQSVLPEGSEGCTASAIRISEDGRRLYVSNRGRGGVCVFDADGARLSRAGYISCGEGGHIREFSFVGNWLLCADEKGHAVSVFPRNHAIGSAPVSVSEFKRVWCILPLE